MPTPGGCPRPPPADVVTRPDPTAPNGPPPVEQACCVCGARAPHPRYVLREMMFGLREPFTYFRCGACGTLQIETAPADLARHYPSTYYSFSGFDQVEQDPAPLRWLVRARVRPLLFGPRRRFRRLGRFIDRRVPVPDEVARTVRPIVARASLAGFDDPILDVGCGSRPARLAAFRKVGFRRLLGVDPFIDGDATYQGIPVLRRQLADVTGQFGLVMFHHSFEHVPDPDAVMARAASLLRPGGSLLIRMPVMGSAMWERYGVNWIELDPPRHLVLLTSNGLRALAARHGLQPGDVVPDSSQWEFVGSEQYQRDVGMLDPGSWFVDPDASPWTGDALAGFATEARRLNAAGTSGRAGFWFRRPAG